jgi:hypothetical protein
VVLIFASLLGKPSPRLFPAPWSAELTPNCFIVRDADGQQLAYVYSEKAWAAISGEVAQQG